MSSKLPRTVLTRQLYAFSILIESPLSPPDLRFSTFPLPLSWINQRPIALQTRKSLPYVRRKWLCTVTVVLPKWRTMLYLALSPSY